MTFGFGWRRSRLELVQPLGFKCEPVAQEECLQLCLLQLQPVPKGLNMCFRYVVWVHAASAKIQPDCWCAWKTNAATPKEPWQRDHGHLVSRVGMTQWSCLGESDMFRGMDTKKSCGIWFGWNILCLKQRIWFASSLSIQFHKILVCWIQFDWRDVHKWFRLSLCQVLRGIAISSLRIAAGRLIWRWRMPKLYQLGKTISKVVWKLYTKRLQCPKALAFYCRRRKVEELKNYQWAGSYNRSRMIKPCLPMLLPPWNK